MRWQRSRQSTHIEDRRGLPPRRRRAVSGGLGGLVVLLAAFYLGVDPQLIGALLDATTGTGAGRPSAEYPQASPAAIPDDPATRFIAAVLGDTEDTWNAVLAGSGTPYREPTLVLFTGAVESACGAADAAVGPFYCPADEKVYLDLGFFDELARRFQAPGDFAQAYVIAHEVGHHVQTILGISRRVHEQRRRLGGVEANALSVRQELQADCFAGIWAHHARHARDLLETGDLEEGLAAAAAVGDDRLQKRARGVVVPESFTHGSSEQRMRWFSEGYRTGRVNACDTFSGAV